MLKRCLKWCDISCGLADIINSNLSELQVQDEKNYIEVLLGSALTFEEGKNFDGSLKFFITQMVNESGKKFKEGDSAEYDEENIKLMILEAVSISRAISVNPAFVNYIGKMTSENATFKKFSEQLICTEEESFKDEYNWNNLPLSFDTRKAAERYFVELFSQMSIEYYDILRKADILSLISRYNDKEDIKDDVEYRIIYPFCKVLELLLEEER